METITTSSHAYEMGDVVVIHGLSAPWWLRLWRWLTRYKPPRLVVVSATSTTITVAPYPLDNP